LAEDTLTEREAKRLLEMLKKSLVDEIMFPNEGGVNKEFDVIGETKADIFSIKIFRGKINPFKYNFGARIKKNGIMLLELHINPSNVHYNPDGSKIVGSHWHRYTEQYGRRLAFPAEDVMSEKFIDNTMKFLIEFNVIKIPKILYQERIF